MSPRAASRLAALGFEEVLDYAAGKADWGGMGLPLEGNAGPWLRDVVRPAPTALLDERRGVASGRGELVVVVHADNVVLGTLGRRAAARDDDVTVEEAMSEGPRTFRPDATLADVRERLAPRGIRAALVTTLDGRLVGIVDL